MGYQETFGLQGRVALITGASSWGIGSATAKVFADAGAKVFLVARNEEALAERCAEIEAMGGTAAFASCDVSIEEQCAAAIEKCVETFGRLDVMVLAAGTSGLVVFEMDDEFDTENWREVQSINLDGAFWFMKYGYKECAKNGKGSIILMSSLAAWNADGCSAYAATKGAMRALATHFGRAFAPLGVRVNAIYPGFIDTDMTHMAFANPNVNRQFLDKVPMDRFGSAEEIGYACLYLASDASSFVTGQHLVVDGGQLCG